MSKPRAESRSQIKKPALRNPGQSLEERLQVILQEEAAVWIAGGVFAVVAAVFEWVRWAVSLPPQPGVMTLTAATIVAIMVLRLRRLLAEMRNLRTGLSGERYIGNFLQNSLLRRGYWVVHDICEDDYNIDHALIGPGGVFAMETKTRTKPAGDARVAYDGQRILVNGQEPDRDAVRQARGAASRLQEILQDRTGLKVPVRPVVLFPGWFVESLSKGPEAWVLNEKAFVTFVDNEPDRLEPKEIFVLAAALGQYVRDQEEKRKP